MVCFGYFNATLSNSEGNFTLDVSFHRSFATLVVFRLAKIKFILRPCCVAPTANEHTQNFTSYSLLTEPETIRLNFNGDFSFCYSLPTKVSSCCMVVVFVSVFLSFCRSHCMLLSMLLFVGSWKTQASFRIQYSTHLPLTFTLRIKNNTHTHKHESN